MNSLGSFFLVLLLLSSNIYAGRQATDLQVIEGIHNYFHNNCIILLVQNHFEDAEGIKLRIAELSKKVTMIVAVSLETLANKYSVIQKTCSRPLLVMPNVAYHRQVEMLLTLSNVIRLAGPVWISFLDKHLDLEKVFSPVNLPFDCEFIVAQSYNNKSGSVEMVTLTEVYRVAEKDLTLRTHAFGSWTKDTGFKGSDLALYARRNDLHGLVIDAVTFQDLPMVIIRQEGNKSTIVGGTIGEHWCNSQKHLNFTFNARPPLNGLWGTKLPNGSWDGMVGMVLRKEAHCALSALIVNPIFSQVVKYCVPVILTSYSIYISVLDGRDVSWSNFLTPFSPSLWLTVLFTTLVIAYITFLVHQLHQRFLQTDNISVSDAFFYIFSAVYCNQSHDQNPPALSTRIIYLIVYVLAVIVVSSYSAFLTSSFTVIKPKIPFDSLEGLIKDGTYELGFQRGAYVARYFQYAKSGLLKEVFDKHIRLSSSPMTATEGLSRVCSNHKYAFVAHVTAVRLMEGKLPCKIFGFPQIFVKLSASYGFCPVHSPYQPLLNFFFLQQLETGIAEYAIKKYSPNTPRPEQSNTEGILIEQVTPILCILLIGILAGALCLFGERLAERVRRKRSRIMRQPRINY